MRAAIDGVRRAVAGRPTRRIFVAEWIDPPFAAGHWLPEMVAAAGGRDVLGQPGRPSFPVTWADVRAAQPELVIVAACGFDAARGAAGRRRSSPTRAHSPSRRLSRSRRPGGSVDVALERRHGAERGDPEG